MSPRRVRVVSSSGTVTPTSRSLTSHIGVSGPVHEWRPPRPLNKPNDNPPSRLRSPAGLLLLGSGLLVLLGLIAAASRAHHTPGGHAGVHSPPSGAGDYVFTIFAILIVGGAAALLYLWFSERDALAEMLRKRRQRSRYRALAFVLVLGLAAAALTRTGSHFLNRGDEGDDQARLVPKGANERPLSPTATRRPQLELLPILVAAGAGFVVLGYIGVRTMRRARAELLEQHALERRFESLLDETLDDLYANTDPRAAIIAAYARMEGLFASSGLPRQPHEAPLEYLGRALADLRASGAALGRLTGLFQRAKFSAHDIDESMRVEAIEALTQVRDELRARREEDRVHRERAETTRSERTDERGDPTSDEDPFAAAAEKARGSIYSGGRS